MKFHYMVTRSTVLHLRIPFSFFLLPIFLFGLSISPNIHGWKTLLTFFIIHFLLYPASNGYNSYFDKDEESIGGLEKPPTVTPDLYWVSLAMDAVALLLGLFIGLEFVMMLFLFGLASKAYSHPAVRLKKRPVTSWLVAGFFQGFFTLLMTYMAVNDVSLSSALQPRVLFAAVLSSLMLWGSYPMTQVYQHQEDSRRGDITLSIRLGIRGTFVFTAVFFSGAMGGFISYFLTYYSSLVALGFVVLLLPVLVYFGWWYVQVLNNREEASFKNTMRLNWLSAISFNVFFGLSCLV